MTTSIVLRPSGSAQWTRCTAAPGFVAELDAAGKLDPDTGSAAADEGTRAHDLAQTALESPDPVGYLGSDWCADVPVEMVAHVRGYVQHCLAAASGGARGMEEEVELFYQPSEVGTVDFWTYSERSKALRIIDLKYGAGVRVSSDGNTQLAIYAESIARVLEARGVEIQVVTATIYQPRVGLGVPSTWVMSRDELDVITSKINEIAGTILSGGETVFAPSETACRWCRAAALCSTRAKETLALTELTAGVPSTVPEPADLRPDQLARIVADAPAVERFIRDVRKFVRAKLDAGDGERYGVKLVEGRPGNRRWRDEDAALDYLEGLAPGESFEVRKVVTAPAAEKILKALGVLNKDEFAELIERPDGSPQMVPLDDPRPALGAGEFKNLEGGE